MVSMVGLNGQVKKMYIKNNVKSTYIYHDDLYLEYFGFIFVQ